MGKKRQSVSYKTKIPFYGDRGRGAELKEDEARSRAMRPFPKIGQIIKYNGRRCEVLGIPSQFYFLVWVPSKDGKGWRESVLRDDAYKIVG